MECTFPEWKNILALQVEIQNFNKRNSRRDHNKNESKLKKAQGNYYRENSTWLKKNIKHKDSEPRIRFCNDTAWN